MVPASPCPAYHLPRTLSYSSTDPMVEPHSNPSPPQILSNSGGGCINHLRQLRPTARRQPRPGAMGGSSAGRPPRCSPSRPASTAALASDGSSHTGLEPTTAPSPSASPLCPSPAVPTEDLLISKLRTQLGVIHPLPAPPPLPAASRSVLGLFALFFFAGAAFDKLLTLRRRRAAEREVRVNDTWRQVPTSGFPLFLEEKDLQRKESVEWVNMVLGKLWKVYRPGIENWIVGLLQPIIDNLQKPDYVNRVEIRQFYLGEEPALRQERRAPGQRPEFKEVK